METNTKTVENGKAEETKNEKRVGARAYTIKRFSECVEAMLGTTSVTEDEEKYLIDLKIKVVQRYMGVEV